MAVSALSKRQVRGQCEYCACQSRRRPLRHDLMTNVSTLKDPSAQRKAVLTITVPQWRAGLTVSSLRFPSGSVELSNRVIS
ncbi:hypothetical protein IG631_23693 [Alternaria alternata]|nr:hypothetical protein IG631_23693 [Alternaria alternata]